MSDFFSFYTMDDYLYPWDINNERFEILFEPFVTTWYIDIIGKTEQYRWPPYNTQNISLSNNKHYSDFQDEDIFWDPNLV